jgi:hypothetical protein
LGARGEAWLAVAMTSSARLIQSAPGWLRQRDQPISRELAGCGPGDTFAAGLALLDRDLGFPLGPQPDDARESGETGVVGRGVAVDVGDVDRCDHAEMNDLDRFGKVETACELLGCGPSVLVGGGGSDRGPDFAGCADQRRGLCGWLGW